MNNLPKRKPNRLPYYNYSSNGSYFITFCVKQRECLLGDIVVGGDVHGAPLQPDRYSPVNCFDVHGAPKHVKDTDTKKSTSDGSDIVLSEYGEVVKKYIELGKTKLKGITIDKYVIMPNHIHMILSVQNDDFICSEKPCHDIIPTYVSTLKTLITKEIGFSLFQRNFHDRIIRDEKEYEKIWNYIDRNPELWAEDTFYI